MIPLYLSPAQNEFLFSEKKYVLFSAGKRSGKSFVGARWIMRKLWQDPSKLLFIGANTYRQLTQVTLLTFNQFLDSAGIEYVYGVRPPWWRSKLKKHDGIYSFRHGGQITCWSLEKGARGRYGYDGLSLGGFWIDETKDTEIEAWNILKERLSEKHATGIQGRITTTPNGAEHWLYDLFVDPSRSEHKKRDFHVIYGSTKDNAHNLEDGYIDDMEDSYDAETILERRDGKFIVRAGGQVYHAFSEHNIINNAVLLPGVPVHIGIDFNVSPMCAIVCQYIDDTFPARFPEHAEYFQKIINQFGGLNIVAVVGEIVLENTNTWEMAKILKQRYNGYHVYMYPDAAGNNRSTQSSKTDIEILQNAGLQCIFSKTNPAVDDRLNWVNAAMCNSKGRRSIAISKDCTWLMNDLRKVKRDNKGKIDKSNPKLTHASDALGYFVSQRLRKIA